MKHLIAIAAVAAIAAISGCTKKTTPAANSGLTEVAPPPPVHNGITPAAPISYADPVVAPLDYASTPVQQAGPAAGRTYVVKRGDTLWGIAQRTYGDGKQYRKILAANPNIKGEQLNVGQKIVIPS